MKIINDCKTCPHKEICKYKSEREKVIDFLKTAQWENGRFIDNVVGLEITITCNFINKVNYRDSTT